MGGTKGFTAGKFYLELDDVAGGYLVDFHGGNAAAEVISSAGAVPYARKRIGAATYEDIVIGCSSGMTKAFYNWVSQAARMQGSARKDGEIVALDASNKEVSRLEFSSGMITEIDFPACDGSSKDSSTLTLQITLIGALHALIPIA